MWDDDDVFLVTVPGWGNSGPQHWQSYWEMLYPLARRVEQDNWLYPTRADWVERLAGTVDDCAGKVVLAAHSLGCHTVVAWLAQASLQQQRKVQGVLLVAPPALPITAERALASGELPQGAALPVAGLPPPSAQSSRATADGRLSRRRAGFLRRSIPPSARQGGGKWRGRARSRGGWPRPLGRG